MGACPCIFGSPMTHRILQPSAVKCMYPHYADSRFGDIGFQVCSYFCMSKKLKPSFSHPHLTPPPWACTFLCESFIICIYTPVNVVSYVQLLVYLSKCVIDPVFVHVCQCVSNLYLRSVIFSMHLPFSSSIHLCIFV